jgi:hypothetical protein
VREGGRVVQQVWVALTGEELLERRDSDWRALKVQPQWRPGDALGLPIDTEGTPPWDGVPLSPRMSVSCVSRGQQRRASPTDHLDSARRAPRNYLLLENSEEDQQALEDRALATYEYMVAVTISLDYYSNPNAKAWPHRIPRYWLPTQARW